MHANFHAFITKCTNKLPIHYTNRMIHFLYCQHGVLVFGDDGTGTADESKMTKHVQGWSC